MSRCSCCGGSCTFNCCTNKAPSNVCVEITKTRLLNPVYKISSSTAYVGYGTKSVIGQAECQYEFNHGKYIQYHFHYGTIGTVVRQAPLLYLVLLHQLNLEQTKLIYI